MTQQITHFLPTVGGPGCIHFPKGRSWGTVRKCWIKARLKPSRANVKSCSSLTMSKPLNDSALLLFLLATFISLGLVPLPIQLSFANISWPWHFQLLGVSNAVQSSFTVPSSGPSETSAFSELSCKDSLAIDCLALPVIWNHSEKPTIPSPSNPSCL